MAETLTDIMDSKLFPGDFLIPQFKIMKPECYFSKPLIRNYEKIFKQYYNLPFIALHKVIRRTKKPED